MDFDAFYKDLEIQLQKLAGKNFRKYRLVAQKDVEEYLRLSRGRLEDYSRLVGLHRITPEEQQFLSEALKQNALLFSLKESGRASVAMRNFAGSMVSLTLELVLAYAIKSL